MKKAFLIFSGYNQRAVIAFLRTLKSNRIPFAIIARNFQDPILLSEYKNRVFHIRSTENLEIGEVVKIIKKVKKSVNAGDCHIAPSTEALNRFLLKHIKELEEIKCRIPLVDFELYERISDKKLFYEECKKNNILVPQEYADLEKTKLPFVAKPKSYYSSKGKVYYPVIIMTDEDLRMFFKKYNPNDFYFEQYIPGRSIYLLYYFSKNGRVYKASQENLIQQPDGKSIVAAVSTDFHLNKESLNYERLFQNSNFYGLVMVEVKRYGNKNYMIEANPRFWGPSQLFIDSGSNLFEAFLEDEGFPAGKITSHNYRTGVRYFWFGGIIETIRMGKKLAYHSYDSERLGIDLKDWTVSDVYRREDTIRIFSEEMSF